MNDRKFLFQAQEAMSEKQQAQPAQQHDKEAAQVSWDDICVNPHDEYLQQGRQQGREAGLASGYRDGYQLGKQKAIEFGIELGFIRGFLNVAANADEEASRLKRTDRINAQMNELRGMIDEFESSMNDMLRSSSRDEYKGDLDISAKMQRIRAKFKLVTVQLNLKNFSLKQVMQDASERSQKESHPSSKADDNEDTTNSRIVSSEW